MIQETLRPEPVAVPEPAEQLRTAVSDRLDAIWSADVPDDAVDLRGVAPDERYDRVERAFTDLDAGERFYLVSDRDSSPVRGFLLDLADEQGDRNGASLERFEVRRQNPETWLVRTVHP